MWDVENHQQIAQPLSGHIKTVTGLAFSPDGKTLISGSEDNSIILWDIDTDPTSLLEKSCQRAGRNFTRAEWEQYFPNDDYQKTCDQWPLESEPTALVTTPTGEAATEAPVVTETPVATEAAANSGNTYVEEFDGNMDSWTPFITTGVDKQFTTTLKNGSLRVQLSPFEDQIPRIYWVNEAFTYTNVQVDAVATNNGNNPNGINLICQYNDYGWYEFSIANSGLYSISAINTRLSPIQAYTTLFSGGSNAIKAGFETNTYTIVCKGNELSLSINGTLVKTLVDTQYNYTEGKIGIGASSPEMLPVDIQFDSLSVSIPN